MATCTQPLPEKSYSLPSRVGGVGYKIERMESKYPALKPGNIPNGLSKLQNRVHSSHCTINNDINNSTNHYIHSQQSQHHQQLNSHVVHQLNSTTSLQPRSSSDCPSSKLVFISIMMIIIKSLICYILMRIMNGNCWNPFMDQYYAHVFIVLLFNN
ncbi:unnamed protein product [Schistosoma mattheei]|uniref:Uncharacterized protein n=1 Tax=Schistosoma mattheei TaxID=31246 RepID=A0A183PXK0_9TREM|nr:unnamed protein product [Schistosoma mattheei]